MSNHYFPGLVTWREATNPESTFSCAIFHGTSATLEPLGIVYRRVVGDNVFGAWTRMQEAEISVIATCPLHPNAPATFTFNDAFWTNKLDETMPIVEDAVFKLRITFKKGQEAAADAFRQTYISSEHA